MPDLARKKGIESHRDVAGNDTEQLTRRALEAQEAERVRLAREIHDDLGQLLVAVRLELDLVRRSPLADPPDLDKAFAGAYGLLDQARDSVHSLCRGLRPPPLEQFGLVPALQHLVADVRARAPLEVEAEFALPGGPPAIAEPVALCLFRTLQETLNNTVKHANAGGIWISLRLQSGDLVLSVSDDGIGIEPGALDQGGFGLVGMQERAELVGGTLAIESRQDEGTRVTLWIPTG